MITHCLRRVGIVGWLFVLAGVLFLPTARSQRLHAQTPASPSGATRPRPAQALTTVFVHVRDDSGHPINGARLRLYGPSGGEFTADGEGVIRLRSIRDGSYFLRVEMDGLKTVDREIAFRGGQPDVIQLVLSPPTPPEPPPPPAPPPPPPPPPPIAQTPPASGGEPKTVSVLGFLDRNFIGRERQKDSALGCTSTATTGILQLRDSLAEHVHGQIDEMLYVVAGDGTLMFDNGTRTPLGPGSLSIVPRGLPHAIERRGKNPLIVLWVHSGESCLDARRP